MGLALRIWAHSTAWGWGGQRWGCRGGFHLLAPLWGGSQGACPGRRGPPGWASYSRWVRRYRAAHLSGASRPELNSAQLLGAGVWQQAPPVMFDPSARDGSAVAEGQARLAVSGA